MDSFIEADNGRPEAQRGCFDDRVFAAAHGLFVLPRAMSRMGMKTKPIGEAYDPFSLNFILDELRRKHGNSDAG
ncbi:MAG: hypothetical protein ACREFD_06125 [Stellaceae bacterium]